MAYAGQVAAVKGRESVGVADLWSGWSLEDGGLGHVLLERLGFRVGWLASEYSAPNVDTDPPPRSDAVETVHEMAFFEALRFDRTLVDTEHLLLALLCDGGPQATDLGRRGLTATQARLTLLRILRDRRDPPRDGPYVSRSQRFWRRLTENRGIYSLAVDLAAVVLTLVAIPPTGAMCSTVYASYPLFALIGAVAGPCSYVFFEDANYVVGEFLVAAGIGAAVTLRYRGHIQPRRHPIEQRKNMGGAAVGRASRLADTAQIAGHADGEVVLSTDGGAARHESILTRFWRHFPSPLDTRNCATAVELGSETVRVNAQSVAEFA